MRALHVALVVTMLVACSHRPRTPRWVPADLSGIVDEEELAPPSDSLDREVEALEAATRSYVALYKPGEHAPHPPKRALCSLFESATLDAAELASVKAAESRHPDVVFVAYSRPLRRK